MSKKKAIFIALAALIVASLGLLHVNFPLPYVFNVMVRQSPDYYDFQVFPASSIAPAERASELPVAPDPRVMSALESHPKIDDVDSFVTSTETTAFLVAHNGQLVFERYGLGHDDNSVENSFSVSKALTSALIGLAAEDGVLALGDPITGHLPELGERDARFSQIKVDNLLGMTSGLAYSRKIKFPIVNNDDPLVYYHPNLASVVLARTEIESAPGPFKYNNYNTPLLGLILKRTTGLSVSEYFEQRVWRPMGAAQPAGWTTDKAGFERMESGFHARARDLARFGLLYLNQGRTGERQVLPEAWVNASTTPDKHIELDSYDGRRWAYKAGWWIVPRPEGRPDYCAIGHFGQFIYISPQFKTVFVRNGPGRGEWGDRDWTALFYYLAEALTQRPE
ncbi:MAG: serine hydrolase [Gammaproteobacteria bacterium]|nr:serine hydrolase [Gammaproteobacteria bacterium]